MPADFSALDAINFISGCLVLFCMAGGIILLVSVTKQIREQSRVDQDEIKSDGGPG